MGASAHKNAIAAAVVISLAMRKKSWKQKCWPTTATQAPSKVFPPMCQSGSARVRSLDARKNTVNATTQG